MAAPARGAAAKAAMNKAGAAPVVKSAPAAKKPALSVVSTEPAAARKPFPPAEPKEAAKEKDPARVIAAQKAAATAEASRLAGGEQTCAGACGEVKPIRAFPTTGTKADGSVGRAKVCRACRDATRAANKAKA